MLTKNSKKKSRWKIASNILFYGLLIFVLVNTNARSWVLQQIIATGLFNAKIKTGSTADANTPDVSFAYYNETGQIASLTDLKGKVVFINFWATWCPPCRAEMPSMHAMFNKLKDDDRFVFLFINEDEDLSKAKAYLKSHAFSFPLSTRAGQVPEALYSSTLPTTVVIDKNGRIAYKREGIANYNTPAFIAQLQNLL